MKEQLGYKHLSVNTMKGKTVTAYQLRLQNKYGRKTIGVGSNYLTALVIAQIIDDEISRQIAVSDEIDLDKLKEIARDELSRNKTGKARTIRVVEKDDIQVLWDRYVEYNTSLNVWSESTILTAIAAVTNLINNCPIQRLEQKTELVQWFFETGDRKHQTSKDRFKWVVSAIDWNSKHGNIPRKWGIEYRDLFESIKSKEAKRSSFQDDDDISIFSVAEVYRIIEALKNDTYSKRKGTHRQFYEYIYFLWLTGCRPSEAIALKWNNVDLTKRKIKFCENQVSASGKIVKKSGTKTVDFRYFPINIEIGNLLCNLGHKKTGYVFTNRLGNSIKQQSLYDIWKPLLNDLGITYRVPYQLRHTMISYHANNDYPIHKLAEIVGNSEKIIKDHYLKLDIEKIFLPDVIKE